MAKAKYNIGWNVASVADGAPRPGKRPSTAKQFLYALLDRQRLKEDIARQEAYAKEKYGTVEAATKTRKEAERRRAHPIGEITGELLAKWTKRRSR